MLNRKNLVLSAKMCYTFTRDTDGLFTLSVNHENECFDSSLLTKLSVSDIHCDLVVMVEYDGLVFEFLPAWNSASEKAIPSGAYCLVGKSAQWPEAQDNNTITFIKGNDGKYMCNLPQLTEFSYDSMCWSSDYHDGKEHFAFGRVFTDGVVEVMRISSDYHFIGWVPMKVRARVDVKGKLDVKTLNKIAKYAAHYYPDKPFDTGLFGCWVNDIIDFQYNQQAQDGKTMKSCIAWYKKHNKEN